MRMVILEVYTTCDIIGTSRTCDRAIGLEYIYISLLDLYISCCAYIINQHHSYSWYSTTLVHCERRVQPPRLAFAS